MQTSRELRSGYNGTYTRILSCMFCSLHVFLCASRFLASNDEGTPLDRLPTFESERMHAIFAYDHLLRCILSTRQHYC